MIRTIQFAGPLADHFGDEPIRFDCDDWPMLFSGLECAYPDFRTELSKYEDLCIAKLVDNRLEYLDESEMPMTFGQAEVIVLAASEEGSAQAAAAYIAEALFAAGTTAYAVAFAVAYIAVTVAIAYATGAVMRALSDSPSADTNRDREKHASYLFNGAQNIVEQGGAIPLIYGRHRVGGTIISTELSTEIPSKVVPDTVTALAGTTYNGNVLSNDIGRQWLTVTGWTLDGISLAANATYSFNSTPATPDQLNDYTVQIQLDGDIVVTSESLAFATHNLTYSTTDSRDNSVASTTVRLTIMQPWEPPMVNDGTGGI